MKKIWKMASLLCLMALLLGCSPDEMSREPSSSESTTAPEPSIEPTTEPETTMPSTIETEPPLTGWQELEGKRYYYSETGEMRTGWLTHDGGRYYLNEDGAMHTGWLEQGADRFYLREDGTMAVGQVSIDGVQHYFTSQGKYVVLVNRWNPVPEDYEMELVEFEGYRVDSSCVEALGQMLADCNAAGYSHHINSAYRSIDKQQSIWDRRYRNYIAAGYSEDEANQLVGQSVAVPGTSEHHLGLAVDIDGEMGVLQWLAEHCWEYGFILRYPDGKTELTGIIYEPWHFRYVGTELALELRDLGLCMEEYMQMLTK